MPFWGVLKVLGDIIPYSGPKINRARLAFTKSLRPPPNSTACSAVERRSEVEAKPSRWSRVRQAEGRRRKSDLRTQPVIDAEARQAKLGSLSDVREPSRPWSRTRAPRAIGRHGEVGQRAPLLRRRLWYNMRHSFQSVTSGHGARRVTQAESTGNENDQKQT